jgi:hypothetical protein
VVEQSAQKLKYVNDVSYKETLGFLGFHEGLNEWERHRDRPSTNAILGPLWHTVPAASGTTHISI